MVKKTSILDKLKTRWKSGAGVRMGAPSSGERPAATVEARTDGLPELETLPALREPERVAGRKINGREDAALALGEGFRELASLMHGMQVRLDDQGERGAALAEEIRALPILGRAQLEVLQRMATQLERQGATSERLVQALGDVPELLRGVQGALARAAAVDERTATTLGEFRSTMERIQGAMGSMVESSRAQANATSQLVREQKADQQQLVETLERGRQHEVQGLVDGLQSSLSEQQRRGVEQLAGAAERGLTSLRQASDEQTVRLSSMFADQNKWSQLLVVLGSLVFFALAGILAVMLLR